MFIGQSVGEGNWALMRNWAMMLIQGVLTSPLGINMGIYLLRGPYSLNEPSINISTLAFTKTTHIHHTKVKRRVQVQVSSLLLLLHTCVSPDVHICV
jgi:hypothetical protein